MTTYPEKITSWRTSDRELFTVESCAIDHQDRLSRAAAATAAIQAGASIGVALRDHGFAHPVEPYHELDDLYVTSELIISYWQCCETPGYQPAEILFDGRLYVGGDAGGWRGSYGGKVTPRDLVTYWTVTKEQLTKYPGLIAQRDSAIAWRRKNLP